MTKRRSKLLVVDDLPDWQKILEGLLSDAGYDVSTVDSIAAAIPLLNTTDFDLAVLDVRLDETDENNTAGLELAKEIKRSWPKTKVIIATGYGTPQVIRKAMEPDELTAKRLADDFISKTETDKLVGVVQRVLAEK